MITFERLPNEILLIVFSNLSWSELLTSFWSLNTRFNILICSVLSKLDNKLNSSPITIGSGLSYDTCHSVLLPLISHSSLLTSCIRYIHFDEKNSNACDMINEWLFDYEKNTFRFPNLKLLFVTRCLFLKSLVQILPLLFKYQLDELTLTFDEKIIELLTRSDELVSINYHISN